MAICSHLTSSLIDALHRRTQLEKIFRSRATSLSAGRHRTKRLLPEPRTLLGFPFSCASSRRTHFRSSSSLSLISQIIFLPLWKWSRKRKKGLATMIWNLFRPVRACLPPAFSFLSFLVLFRLLFIAFRPDQEFSPFSTDWSSCHLARMSICRSIGFPFFCCVMQRAKRLRMCCQCASGHIATRA